MKSIFAMTVVTIGILMGSQAYADQWVVRRATTSGACHVGKASERPELGTQLGSAFPDAKAACDDAKKRKAKSDDDTANSSKCQAYTSGAIKTCKDAGVTL